MPSAHVSASRRRFLAAAGSGALASLAGCVDSLEEIDGDVGDGRDVSDPTRDWPAPHFDAAGTSYNPAAVGPTSEPSERWRVASDRPTGRIVVAGGTAYVPTSEALVARDVATGEVQWRLAPVEEGDGGGSVGRPYPTAPCVVDGTVFVGTRDRRGLLALDAATGAERWRYAPGEDPDVSAAPVPLGDGQWVAYGDESGRVAALDVETGEVAWGVGIFGRVSHLAASLTTVYAGTSGGDVYAFYEGTGVWRRKLPGEIRALAVEGTSTVYAGTFGGGVFRLRGAAHAGRTDWHAPEGPTAHGAFALADGVLVGTDLARARGLRTRTGEVRWEVDGSFGAPPAAAGDTAYLPSDDGVVAVHLDGGTGLGDLRFGARRFTYGTGGTVAGVTVADDALLFATLRGESGDTAVHAVE
jgi:outer membrane protein assembly factor BamB